MRSILAVATLALIALVVEDKARQVAGNAHDAYGDVVDHARETTVALGRKVERKPLMSLAVAGGVGFAVARLARLMPRRA